MYKRVFWFYLLPPYFSKYIYLLPPYFSKYKVLWEKNQHYHDAMLYLCCLMKIDIQVTQKSRETNTYRPRKLRQKLQAYKVFLLIFAITSDWQSDLLVKGPHKTTDILPVYMFRMHVLVVYLKAIISPLLHYWI